MEPQQNPELLGQANPEQALLDGALSGRLAHAWLLTGSRGVGKATLAYRFARFLLAGEDATRGGLFGEAPSSLALDPAHPSFVASPAAAIPICVRLRAPLIPRPENRAAKSSSTMFAMPLPSCG